MGDRRVGRSALRQGDYRAGLHIQVVGIGTKCGLAV